MGTGIEGVAQSISTSLLLCSSSKCVGVMNASLQQAKPAPGELDDRYIQEVRTIDGISIAVTLLRDLAEGIHSASFVECDDTYKRSHGKWKEWEVVIWLKRLDMRTYISLQLTTNVSLTGRFDCCSFVLRTRDN
jgi:hypothetical protein